MIVGQRFLTSTQTGGGCDQGRSGRFARGRREFTVRDLKYQPPDGAGFTSGPYKSDRQAWPEAKRSAQLH